MLLRTIALDYDGTIATNGVLHPKVREAIREARNAGLLVIIVTGRILRELRRVAGDLSFVDAVVAENGAVILLSNSHRRMLVPPPFPALLNELSVRGIEFVVGRCLVDLDAEHAHTVLSIIEELGIPLAISSCRLAARFRRPGHRRCGASRSPFTQFTAARSRSRHSLSQHGPYIALDQDLHSRDSGPIRGTYRLNQGLPNPLFCRRLNPFRLRKYLPILAFKGLN